MADTLTTNVHDTALLFEGGGMRGAYTAAVVATLIEEGIDIDYVAGISAGSSHTCNYVSRDARRARRTFVDMVEDPGFGGMGTFLEGKGYFNAHYIYQEASLPGRAFGFDWETFLEDPADARFGAFNATRGEERWFHKSELTSVEDLLTVVRASSSLPVLMPPVTIDGDVYVDGALGPSGGIPLDVAERDGYQKVFAVLTRPREYRKRPPKPSLQRWFRRHYAESPAVAAGINNRWWHYNRMRERLLEMEAEGRALLFFPEDIRIQNTETHLDRLQAAYDRGLTQARADLPRWRAFLGL